MFNFIPFKFIFCLAKNKFKAEEGIKLKINGNFLGLKKTKTGLNKRNQEETFLCQ